MDLVERRAAGYERHPWETARALAVEHIIRGLRLKEPRVLDVGCGDAYLVAELQRKLGWGQVIAQDIHLTDALRAELARPGIALVRMLKDVPHRVDLVLLLDVLEHVEKPEQLLRDVVRDCLAPGGMLLITVPAFQSLFTDHDRALRHYKRYSRAQLVREVSEAGLSILDTGYLFASLIPPRAVAVLTERLRLSRPKGPVKGVGQWRAGPLVTTLVHGALVLDNSFCLAAHDRGVDVPGLTLWLTCRAPS